MPVFRSAPPAKVAVGTGQDGCRSTAAAILQIGKTGDGLFTLICGSSFSRGAIWLNLTKKRANRSCPRSGLRLKMPRTGKSSLPIQKLLSSSLLPERAKIEGSFTACRYRGQPAHRPSRWKRLFSNRIKSDSAVAERQSPWPVLLSFIAPIICFPLLCLTLAEFGLDPCLRAHRERLGISLTEASLSGEFCQIESR